jgi:uncharacterized surface protein with fasciclin (FAS1) repeats
MPDSTFFVANGPNISGLSTSDQPLSPQVLQYLEYTIIPSQVLYSPLLNNGSSFSTAAGVNLTITTLNGSTYVNDAKITWKDLLVANGVMHVIDKVYF